MVEEKLRLYEFRFVERLLYDQKTHEASIEELEAQLESIMPNYSRSVVKFDHNPPHREESQPEEWTIKRNESVLGKYLMGRIAEKKRHKKAVSDALMCLDETEGQLYYLKYKLEKPSKDCWRSMGLKKSRFYEVRRQVVYKVARYLGLI